MTQLHRIHRSIRTIALVGALALLGGAIPVAMNSADAATNCSNTFTVNETLSNGARWQLCWEKRQREGIVLHEVTYTPPGGSAVEILGQANLGQIHVPYDDNGARFHDESDYGLGDPFLDPLQAADCPNGDLLSDGSHNVICQTIAPTGYAYKDYSDRAQRDTLTLFSVSHIGAYNYVIAWNLDDDGTIRPEVGATGSLQRYGSNTTHGWNVGNGNIAVAHMHNFYWRLDFDVDGPADDRVQELAAVRSGDVMNDSRTAFSTETARRVAPTQMRSWRIKDNVTTNADGHQISWELLPNTDNIFRGPDYEPWTHNELYVTRTNSCERFASHNPTQGGCGNNVSSFVNGESLNGDLTVWYGVSFHHLPRDEDEPHMHAHWTGFTITPRDLTAENIEP